jgi:hypothetical protein
MASVDSRPDHRLRVAEPGGAGIVFQEDLATIDHLIGRPLVS